MYIYSMITSSGLSYVKATVLLCHSVRLKYRTYISIKYEQSLKK